MAGGVREGNFWWGRWKMDQKLLTQISVEKCKTSLIPQISLIRCPLSRFPSSPIYTTSTSYSHNTNINDMWCPALLRPIPITKSTTTHINTNKQLTTSTPRLLPRIQQSRKSRNPKCHQGLMDLGANNPFPTNCTDLHPTSITKPLPIPNPPPWHHVPGVSIAGTFVGVVWWRDSSVLATPTYSPISFVDHYPPSSLHNLTVLVRH